MPLPAKSIFCNVELPTVVALVSLILINSLKSKMC